MDRLCKELYSQFYGSQMFEYSRVLRMDEMYFAALQNFNGGDKSRLLLVGIGLLLLLAAIFNYINLSFELAVSLAVTAAFLSVLWQTLRAANASPARELKKE